MKSEFRENATTPVPNLRNRQSPSSSSQWQQIALAAYFKAEARGFCPGHELDDWLEAEREVMAETTEEELAA